MSEIEIFISKKELEEALAGRFPKTDVPPEKLAVAEKFAEELVEAEARKHNLKLTEEVKKAIVALLILIVIKATNAVENLEGKPRGG
jgi:hypothetical protein